MEYKYRERDGVVFRGAAGPPFDGKRMDEYLADGKWLPVENESSGLRASLYGTAMTEDEAKEFDGEGWPDESQSPQGEAPSAQASDLKSGSAGAAPTSKVDIQQPRTRSTESPA